MPDRVESIQELPIIDEMRDSYLTFAMSVIMSRAIPDARDGLKPSQRRILVAMNDLNLGPRSQHRKCAKIAGDTQGNYHPHGQEVIYPTLVRLAQGWAMRYPLVDGQGNFGSIDGDPPAAMRYTEARMAALATEMLDDIQLDTVDFEPNYDGTRREPVCLPSKFPNLLVNGSSGIAVGMATNIPSHNLNEICDAVVRVIDEPGVSIEELMKVVPGPDFPTGGTICGRAGIREGYRTGRGTIVVRGKVHVEQLRGGRKQIVVTQIPYQIFKNTITERIVACVKSGQLPDVADIRDESDRKNPIRLVIELKREANEDVVINRLYQFTPLQSNFVIMNIAIVGRQPRTLNFKQMIELFIDHRKDVIRRRTTFLLRRARQRAHVLEGLILAVGDIDRVIELIKASADPATAKERLMGLGLRLVEHETLRALLPEPFAEAARAEDQNLTGAQADAILAMQLQRLTGLEVEKLAKEYAKLCEDIRGYEAILRDERLVLDIIREDMFELKEKHGDERHTEITEAVEEFKPEELIAEEQVVVTVSHHGYIKRVPVDAYRTQGRGGKGVRGAEAREGDFVEQLFVAGTHDYLLIFTNRGRVYWLKVYDIPSMQRSSRGRAIANLIRMQSNEVHRAILPVREFEESFVFFATAKGTVKKTPLGAFSRPRPSGIVAISLDPDDALIGVERTTGSDQIVLGSRDGLAIRFSEDDVRPMGRSARGVKGMDLRGKDLAVGMVVVQPNTSLLTVCEKGFGKRTDIDEYRLTRRGGKGVINVKTTVRNGKVVALKSLTGKDELMLITAQGIALRTGLDELREIGRATQGVRIIRVNEEDKVVAVARIAPEDEEADGRQEPATGAESGSPESANGSAEAESDSTEPGERQADASGPPGQDPSAQSETD